MSEPIKIIFELMATGAALGILAAVALVWIVFKISKVKNDEGGV